MTFLKSFNKQIQKRSYAFLHFLQLKVKLISIVDLIDYCLEVEIESGAKFTY